MYKLFFTTSLIALVAGSGVSVAQDAPAKQETVLSTIVVTPLRRESALASATASVTVIDRASIEKAPTQDITQFLKSQLGLSVRNSGGIGSTSSILLRGMVSNKTLVLLNGVRAASATTGATAWANIPLETVERIEIVRGPHSAAYGADAIGGVINIITREGGACGNGKVMCGSITAGVSYPWGAFTNADVRGEKDGTTFGIGGSLIGTRGYDFTYPTTGGHEPDDDGFLRGSFNFNLAKRFDWGKLYADGQLSRGRTQYDSGGNYISDAKSLVGKVGARINHSDDWSTTLEASQGYDWLKAFNKLPPAAGNVYQTSRTGVLARSEKNFISGDYTHTFVLGGEAYRESVKTTPTNFAVTERDLLAAFGQYSLDVQEWRFDSGIRYDYNEQFGDAFTYNLGAAYDLTPDFTLRSSWATGFRAPSFNDLYSPFGGNPDLKPEHSHTAEIGLVWEPIDGTKFDVSLYRTWLKNGVEWASAAPWLPSNVDRARVTGLELSAEHRLTDRVNIHGSLEIMEPRNEVTGDYLIGNDRFKSSFGFDFDVNDKLALSATGFYGAGTYDKDWGINKVIRLEDYFTVDLTALYKLDDQASFKLAAENLFDAEYSTAKDYRAPGRTVTFSFTRKF